MLPAPTREPGGGLRAGTHLSAIPRACRVFEWHDYRTRSFSMRSLLVLYALFVFAMPPAHAQAGALYRCAAVEYTNMLSASEAQARQCAKIGNAEWVAAASDSAGNKYEYHDRRTVYRGNGSVETWLQVVRSGLPENDIGGARTADVRTVSLQTIECARKTIASGPTYLFDPRDNTVIRDARARSEFFPLPRAVAETLVRQLCVGVERTSGRP